jgi:hypothetical protein
VVGEWDFWIVSLSHRAQQIIAVTLSVIILTVIGTTLMREYYSPNTTTGKTNSTATPAVKAKESTVENIDKPVEPAKQKKESKKTTDSPKNYEFTAQPGASYTALARVALQEHAKINNVSLTDAQINNAADVLAYNAGSPYLEIGQVVVIAQSDVSTVVGVKTGITPPATAAKTTPTATEDKTSSRPYSYVVAAGDAYSVIARKAISDYIASTQRTLSTEQRIAAETYVSSDAGFPEVEIGQTVTLSTDTIKGSVDKAKSLSANQLADWAPYVALAGL